MLDGERERLERRCVAAGVALVDMAGILIIAHAPLATALRACITHIYGGCPARIGALDVAPDGDPAEILAAARAEVARLREDNGVLVLTDMFGATPSNIACGLASAADVRVLSGVSLPMLVRAVCYRATPLDLLADKALAGGASGMQACGAAPVSPSASSPCSSSDPAEHHAATRSEDR